MADQSTRLILDALNRAIAQPAGMPLFAAKSSPGLFPATAKARLAAQRCREDGFVQVADAPREITTITDKGLNWLLSQSSPRQVLEDFVRVLEEKQAQAADLIEAAREMSASLDSLRAAVERLGPLMTPVNGQIHHVHRADCQDNPGGSLTGDALSHLQRWRAQSNGDCPLPDLFRRLATSHRELTVGQFHDALRHLHDEHQVYLHPWTGPLYDLPEPPFALLIGHEIAYYASIRE